MTDSIYPHFSEEELSCHCGNCDLGPNDMDRVMMEKLVFLRRTLGFPFPVTSAIRCPDHNQVVSPSTGRTGPHTTGKAVDILVSTKRAHTLMKQAMFHGFTGIGVKQSGDHRKRFVHIDTLKDDETPGPRPTVWSY